jgi:hypothetical protein
MLPPAAPGEFVVLVEAPPGYRGPVYTLQLDRDLETAGDE